MPAYMTISVGATPDTAQPLLASADPEIVTGAVRALLGRVDRPERHTNEPAPQAANSRLRVTR